jgi:hypothetical protein
LNFVSFQDISLDFFGACKTLFRHLKPLTHYLQKMINKVQILTKRYLKEKNLNESLFLQKSDKFRNEKVLQQKKYDCRGDEILYT